MANVVGSLLIKLGMSLAEFDKKMNQAGKKLDRFGRRTQRYGDTLTRNVTLPLLALGTAAVKTASDYETAFAGVRKTVDATEEEFAALSAGIIKMSTEIPASAVAIASVAEAAGQLGIAKQDLLAFTRIMIDLGNTTDIEARTAAIQLARIASITQMSADDYDNLGSAIVELGNNYSVFESEIVEMATTMAGTAKVADMTQDKLAGIAAALASIGIQSQIGSTAFSKTIIAMMQASTRGGKELERFGRIAGTTGKEFARIYEEDSAEAFTRFIEGLARLKTEGQDVFEALSSVGLADVRITRALINMAMAGGKLRDMLRDSKRAWQDNTALTEEARKRYETFASKLTVFINKLKEIGIETGEKLIPKLEAMLPLVERLASIVGTVLDKFAALPTEVQIGLLVAGPVLSAAGSVAQIGAALMRLPGWAKIAGLAVLGAGGAFAVLKNKAGEANEELEVHTEIVKTMDGVYRKLHGEGSLLMHALAKSIGGAGPDGGFGAKIGAWLKDWVKKFEGFENYIQGWGDNIANVFAQGIADGDLWAKKWSDWIDSIIADLARLIAQLYITQPLVRALQGLLDLPTTSGPLAPQPGDANYSAPAIGGTPPGGIVGDQSVTIVNQTGMPVTGTAERGPGGGLRVYLKSAVSELIAGGELDVAIAGATGGRRQPRRR